MWYDIALLIHILGAIMLFVAVSLITIAFVRMRQALTLEQIREWAGVAQFAGMSLSFVGLIILAPAIYMVVVAWGFTTPWVLAALITFVLVAVMGATVSGRAIQQVNALIKVAPSSQIPDELRAQLLAPQLWLAEGIRLMVLLGVVCLMTLKPDLLFTLLILFVTLTMGVIAGTIAGRSPGPRPVSTLS